MRFRIFNFIVFIVGILALLFLLGVAAFEFDDSNLSYNIHFACAVLTIFLESLFSFGQIIIGVMLPPKGVWWKRLTMLIQLIIKVLGIVLFFYFFGTSYHPALLFYKQQHNTYAIGNNSVLIQYYNKGLSLDYSRAIAEWIILTEVIAFYLTLIPDFSRIRVELVVARPRDTTQGKVETVEGNEMKSL